MAGSQGTMGTECVISAAEAAVAGSGEGRELIAPLARSEAARARVPGSPTRCPARKPRPRMDRMWRIGSLESLEEPDYRGMQTTLRFLQSHPTRPGRATDGATAMYSTVSPCWLGPVALY